AGTGGQCLLSPPNVDKGVYVPYFWYNIGGGLLNLLTSLIIFVIWTLVEELPIGIDAFLLFFSVIGLFLALTNIIPFKIGGILNDGANILQMRRNPSARIDFALQLRINADLQRGIRLKDMSDEYFVEKSEIDYSNIFQVSIQLICASRYIDQFQYEKAQQMFEEAMKHKEKIVALLVKEMRCELLFLELIGKRREEVIESLYDKELDKYVKTYSKVMSAKQRLLFALSLCRDKNRVAAEAILNEVKCKQEAFLMKGEVLSDIAIMEDCLSR
ncbi:MAG: M50 family metallopeptidase, partial [Phocaeicola sp.]